MKGLAEFTKTTLIGGLLIVLPIYVTLLLLAKTVAGLLALLAPVADQLPAEVGLKPVLAALILVALCFVAGIGVRTGPGLRAKNALERSLLERIPGYSLVRGLAGRVVGSRDDATFSVALIELEDALVPAFIVEEMADGYTVFVPSVPTPAAGSIYLLPRERVHRVDVPFTAGVSVISRWGTGAGALLEAMRKARGISARDALIAAARSSP